MCWLVHAAVAHHCTTLLLCLCNIHHSVKRLCRKHGISKWPYRQLLSIDGQLERLEADLQKAVSKPSPQSSDELQNVTELQDRISAMRVDRAALVAGESLGETKDQQQQQQQQPVLVCAVKRPSRANAAAAVVTADSSSDSECESKATPKKKHYRVMQPLERPLERLLAPAATVSTISPQSAACAYGDVDRAQQQQQHQHRQHHHYAATAAAAVSFEAALHGVWDSDMLTAFDAGAWPEFFKTLPVPVSTAQQQQSVAVPLQQQQQQQYATATMHHFHYHMPVLPTPCSSLSNTGGNNNNDGSASSSSSSSNTYNTRTAVVVPSSAS
eukprot:17778-Heterococcus_DN1.PRE.4